MERTQRWIFTKSELEHPEKCNAFDEPFLVKIEEAERPIRMYRYGKSTGFFSDGVKGPTPEETELAESDDEYYSETLNEAADEWHNVICDEHGNFIRFADPK